MKIEATPKEFAELVLLLKNQQINSNTKPITVQKPEINLARMATKIEKSMREDKDKLEKICKGDKALTLAITVAKNLERQ